MRFLSPHPGYSVQVAPPEEKVEVDPITGQSYTRTARIPLVADFEAGHGLFPHEVELALSVFGDQGAFGGLPDGTNPATRIAVWDSEAHAIFNRWEPSKHQAIIDKMKMLAAQNPTRMVAVEDNWRAKPWPKYDEQDADEIFAYVQVLGIDPESVRLYEGENAQRADLMTKLQSLVDGTYVEAQPDLGAPLEGEVLATVTA